MIKPELPCMIDDSPDQHVRGSVDELIKQTEHNCAIRSVKSLTAIVNCEFDAAEIFRLLASPVIRSIIIAQPWVRNFPAGDHRIGILNSVAGTWTLPQEMGSKLLLIGESFRPSLTIIYSALRHNLSGYFEAVGHDWRWQSFASSTAKAVLRSAGLTALHILQEAEISGKARNNFAGRVISKTARSGRNAILISSWSNLPAISRDHLTPPLLPPNHFDPGRILMVNGALACGGAERQLVNSMIGLVERGYEPSMICDSISVSEGTFFRPQLLAAGIEVGQIRRARAQFGGRIPAAMFDAIASSLQRLPPSLSEKLWPYVVEIVFRAPGIVHAWQDQSCILAGAAAVIAGVPRVILSTRNVSPQNFGYLQPHMRESYRALVTIPSVRIINNSLAGATDYAQWMGVVPESISIVRNGVENSVYSRPETAEVQGWLKAHGVPVNRPIVGSAFRFNLEKDPMLWLQTAAFVAQRTDAIFLVLGTGPMLEQARQRANRMGIGDRVFLPGNIPNPKKAFAAMDVFLLTSRFEGLPNVVIETQALGVPVVATRSGGTEEAFLPGATGWLETTRSPKALAERVCFAIENAEWSQEVRHTAPAFIRQRFGLQRMISETIEVYETIRLDEQSGSTLYKQGSEL